MVREHPTLSSGYSQTSGVPPDNPQEQVLRGPAGEEAVGGQQGVLQPKVPHPMNVNSTTSSLLPPASLQQQVLRGPAGEEAPHPHQPRPAGGLDVVSSMSCNDAKRTSPKLGRNREFFL